MKNLADICSGREFPDGPNGLKDVKLKDFRFYAHTIEDAARKLNPETILIARDAVYDAAFEERIKRLYDKYHVVEVTGKEFLQAFLPPPEVMKNYDSRTRAICGLPSEGVEDDGSIVFVSSNYWKPEQVFGIPWKTKAEQNKVLPIWIPEYSEIYKDKLGFEQFVDDFGNVEPYGKPHRDSHRGVGSSHRRMMGLTVNAGQWLPHYALPCIPEERGRVLASMVPGQIFDEMAERLPMPAHPEYRTKKESTTSLNRRIGPLFLV